MGYWTSLHLIDIRIKASSLEAVKRTLMNRKLNTNDSYQFFFQRAVLDSEGFLCFKASEKGGDPYVPDEDDGTVPALYSKWYEVERIAEWIKPHCRKGGQVILHSIEADGGAWGWEFDGRGRMRELRLSSFGKWR